MRTPAFIPLQISEKKKDSEDIWSVEPHPQGNHWEGDISSTARIHAIYRYSVDWKETASGPVHTDDPKISIRPESVFEPFIEVLAFFVAAVLAIFAVKYFSDKKRK